MRYFGQTIKTSSQEKLRLVNSALTFARNNPGQIVLTPKCDVKASALSFHKAGINGYHGRMIAKPKKTDD